MVKIIMGKINSHYKKIIFFACLCMVVFFSALSTAAVEEDELLEKGYENYISVNKKEIFTLSSIWGTYYVSNISNGYYDSDSSFLNMTIRYRLRHYDR